MILKVLFINHEDSSTWNLVAEITALGICCDVRTVPFGARRLDWFPTPATADRFLAAYHGVVLSPGPGHPCDFPLSAELLNFMPQHMPLLGVCLGWQIVALKLGFPIESLAATLKKNSSQEQSLLHGRRELLTNSEKNVFWATFFNSLAVKMPNTDLRGDYRFLPDSYGMVALARHRSLPRLLTQFHPESYASSGCGFVFEDFFACVSRFAQSKV